jgi:hypothetical protein
MPLNKRHKAVFALSLATAGIALLQDATMSAALGIILIGVAAAWLVGSQFVLTTAAFTWRHRLWSIAIIVVGISCVYGWSRYDAYRIRKQHLEADAWNSKMRPIWDCETRNRRFSNAESECTKDPTIVLEAIVPPASEVKITPDTFMAKNSLIRSTPHAPTRYVKSLNSAELTTTEYGSLTCGHIQKGEVAILLADDGLQVRIKSPEGQTGWASAANFEVATK